MAVALLVCTALGSAAARALPGVAGVGPGAQALEHPGAAPVEDYAALLASAPVFGPPRMHAQGSTRVPAAGRTAPGTARA